MTKLLLFIFSLICFCQSTSAQAQEISHPKIKWRFKTDGPIRGTGVVSDQHIYFGSSDGWLYALDKKDGTLRWKAQTGGAITSTPAISDSFLYAVSRDRSLYAFNTINGKVIWKFGMQKSLPSPYGGWDYFASSPVVAGNMILTGSADGHLYALERTTGKLLWKFETRGMIRATPLLEGNVIYQPSNDGYVYVIDRDTGKLLWKFETRGASLVSKDFGFDRNSIFTKPVIKKDLLVFGSRDGNVYGVDINTHQEKWHFSYGPTWAMAVTVDDESVFVGWSTNNIACALDLQTGKEQWKYQAGAHVYTVPLALESAVYFGSADGKVYSLSKKTGEKKWEYVVGKEVYSSPVEDSGSLYFGCDDGFLYALEDDEEPVRAVYQPAHITGNNQYLIVDAKITPHLIDKGFQQLDSAGLHEFITRRLEDRRPSVVVFSFPLIPRNIIGETPETGMMRQYLESGGKVLWLGDIPNYYEPDASGNFKRDPASGTRLLEVEFPEPSESGNYYSRATADGLNWGLPGWLKTTNATVSPEGVIPLAYDEFGRVSVWIRKFNPRPGSGFVSFRSWAWNVPIQQEDLALIHQLAIYQLQ